MLVFWGVSFLFPCLMVLTAEAAQTGCAKKLLDWKFAPHPFTNFGVIKSGQRSLWPQTSDFTPQMVVNSKGNGTPAISGKSRLVKYYNLARLNDLFWGNPTWCKHVMGWFALQNAWMGWCHIMSPANGWHLNFWGKTGNLKGHDLPVG